MSAGGIYGYRPLQLIRFDKYTKNKNTLYMYVKVGSIYSVGLNCNSGINKGLVINKQGSDNKEKVIVLYFAHR